MTVDIKATVEEDIYQMCPRCLMDTTDPRIYFTEDGCNHCTNFLQVQEQLNARRKPIEEIVDDIQRKATGTYDCIMGISGGADSSFTAYLVWKYGLNALLVHVDNGWNVSQANYNVQQIKRKTGFDLEVLKLDEAEANQVLLAFFKSNTTALEVPTDVACAATVWNYAQKHEIKTIISGQNWVTEGIHADAWSHRNTDIRFVKDVLQTYGVKTKTFPMLGLSKILRLQRLHGYRRIPLLNISNIRYSRDEAITLLNNEWNWQPHGPKHTESHYTKFVEYYICPTKFQIDKRKQWLSAQVMSGQISRHEALNRLRQPFWESREEWEDALLRFVKNLGITQTEFELIMGEKPVPINRFKTDDRFMWFARLIAKVIGR